jgi:PAS domain S-box-containing protein
VTRPLNLNPVLYNALEWRVLGRTAHIDAYRNEGESMHDQEKREGEMIQEVAALQQKLSAMQAAEESQRETEAALLESERRFRKIFEHSNDAIYLIDPESNAILDVNPVACRMLGYSREELLALSVAAIHPHEMPQLQSFARSVFDRGRGWTNELSCRTKDGYTVPAEISASLVEIDGRTCLIALVRDTSERKEAELRVRKEAARADALAHSASRLNAQLDLDAVLAAVCEETANALDVPAAAVLFFDPEQALFYPAATWGLPPSFQRDGRSSLRPANRISGRGRSSTHGGGGRRTLPDCPGGAQQCTQTCPGDLCRRSLDSK